MHTYNKFYNFISMNKYDNVISDCTQVNKFAADGTFFVTTEHDRPLNLDYLSINVRLGLTDDELYVVAEALRELGITTIKGHCGDRHPTLKYLDMLERARKRLGQDEYPTPWASDCAPDETFLSEEAEFHYVDDPLLCIYEYTQAYKAYERSQEGDQSNVNVIFGRDVPSNFQEYIHGSLSPDTAYLFSREANGKYQPFHMTYRKKTLQNFESAERKFKKEVSIDED